jgi:hypothetical protein
LSEVVLRIKKIGYKGLSMGQVKNFERGSACVLKDVKKLKTPVPFNHPPGAITWVTLDEPTTKKVLFEAENSSEEITFKD